MSETPCGRAFTATSDAESHRVTCGECAGVEDRPARVDWRAVADALRAEGYEIPII